MAMLIAVDFDDTLWSRADKQLNPGAKEAISTLRMNGHRVIIFSCNSPRWIRQVLMDNDLMVDGIWGEVPGDAGTKPNADVFIDDRALTFTNWPDILKQLMERPAGGQ